MASAKNSSENYASILQFVAYNLPPFLQDGGEPTEPLFAWFTALLVSSVPVAALGGICGLGLLALTVYCSRF